MNRWFRGLDLGAGNRPDITWTSRRWSTLTTSPIKFEFRWVLDQEFACLKMFVRTNYLGTCKNESSKFWLSSMSKTSTIRMWWRHGSKIISWCRTFRMNANHFLQRHSGIRFVIDFRPAAMDIKVEISRMLYAEGVRANPEKPLFGIG